MLQIQHDHILSCYQIHQVKNKIGFTLSNSEKAMAPHFSTLAWKIHGQRSLVGCSPWGRQESDTTERLHFHSSLSCIGERNGNPLQCSCLENPRDSGAQWAAVYGVTQSRTRLKRLSTLSNYPLFFFLFYFFWLWENKFTLFLIKNFSSPFPPL